MIVEWLLGSTQHTAHDTRHTAHGTQHAAPGTRHTAPGTRHTAHGTRHPAHGTRHAAHGTQHTVVLQQPPTPIHVPHDVRILPDVFAREFKLSSFPEWVRLLFISKKHCRHYTNRSAWYTVAC